MQDDKLHDFLLKGYSYELVTTTSSQKGSLQILNCAFPQLYAFQPEILKKVISNTHIIENGLLSRYVFCLEQAIPTPPDREYTTDLNLYNRTINRIINHSLQDNGKRNIKSLRLSQQAQRLLDSMKVAVYYKQCNYTQEETKLFLNKLCGLAVRFASAVHIYDTFYTKGELIHEDYFISETTMHNGIELAWYSFNQATDIYSDLGFRAREDAQLILKWIEQWQTKWHKVYTFFEQDSLTWHKITPRDIQQSISYFKKYPQRIDPALTVLAQHNYIRPLQVTKQEQWCVLNPYFFRLK